jgi:hypothetical protein
MKNCATAFSSEELFSGRTYHRKNRRTQIRQSSLHCFHQKNFSAEEPQTATTAVFAILLSSEELFIGRTYHQKNRRPQIRQSSLHCFHQKNFSAGEPFRRTADRNDGGLRYGTFIRRTFHRKSLSSEEPQTASAAVFATALALRQPAERYRETMYRVPPWSVKGPHQC